MNREAKYTIFIVDDDPSIREVMAIILEDKGYSVLAFSDEASFFDELKKTVPDLIFLDLRISGSKGQEIARRMKENETTKNVPVIIVSAMTEAAVIAKESGADDFLEKPFEIEDLLKKVSLYLS